MVLATQKPLAGAAEPLAAPVFAGYGAGERLAQAGVRHALCINHEVGNLSQDARCRGFADALGKSGGTSRVLQAVQAGQILFAIDQQQYLQGYLPIVLLTKYLETRTMPGGGQVIRTGPSFVTRENAGEVAALTARGIR